MSYTDEQGYTVFTDDLDVTLLPRIQQLSNAIRRLKAALSKTISEAKKKKVEQRARREQWAKQYFRKSEPLRFNRSRRAPKPVSWKSSTKFKQVPWNENQKRGFKKFVEHRNSLKK